MPHKETGVAVPSLRAYRRKAALKQTELAHLAGIGRSTVLRAEAGGNVSLDNARSLAQALGVAVEDLQKESR